VVVLTSRSIKSLIILVISESHSAKAAKPIIGKPTRIMVLILSNMKISVK
jgi:hypothetical protein